jgi:esterase/lipase
MKIILLHGSGASPITLLPLEYYLNRYGFEDTHKIGYETRKQSFEEAFNEVCEKIQQIIYENEPFVAIGQSFGGLISNKLHTKFNVAYAIYIVSPLKGAYAVKYLNEKLSPTIKQYLHREIYEELLLRENENQPPHKYNTITTGWGYSEFDGCVFKEEAVLEESKNYHITWSDHRLLFMSLRLFRKVFELLTLNVE